MGVCLYGRLTYSEAIDILTHAHSKQPFHSEPKVGCITLLQAWLRRAETKL